MSIVLGTVVAMYAIVVGLVFKQGMDSAEAVDASVAHTLVQC